MLQYTAVLEAPVELLDAHDRPDYSTAVSFGVESSSRDPFHVFFSTFTPEQEESAALYHVNQNAIRSSWTNTGEYAESEPYYFRF